MRRKPIVRESQHVIQTRRANYLDLVSLKGPPVDRSHIPPPPKPREDHPDLEKHVIRPLKELLAIHPKVLIAIRQNSGAASYEAASGKWAPVKFYEILTSQPVRIVDFWGFMKDGRPLALEAKRPSWKRPTDKREIEQANFLMLIRNIGGVAGFVRSTEEANALLNG